MIFFLSILVGIAICSFIMHLAYPPPKNLSDPIFNKRASLDERNFKNLNDEDQVVVDALAAAGCWGEYLCSNGEFVRVEHFVKPKPLVFDKEYDEVPQWMKDLCDGYKAEPWSSFYDNLNQSIVCTKDEMSIARSDMERLRKDLYQAKAAMFEAKSKLYQGEIEVNQRTGETKMYKRPGGYEQVWGL